MVADVHLPRVGRLRDDQGRRTTPSSGLAVVDLEDPWVNHLVGTRVNELDVTMLSCLPLAKPRSVSLWALAKRGKTIAKGAKCSLAERVMTLPMHSVRLGSPVVPREGGAGADRG